MASDHTDTGSAVALARLDERMGAIETKLRDILELGRANAQEQRIQNERLIRLELRLESELKRSADSGERCLRMLEDMEARLRAVETRPVPDPREQDREIGSELRPDTGVHEQLTAAQTEESKARTKLWGVISSVFGGLVGALTTWLATKR